MSQVFDNTDPENPTVHSDLVVPADAEGNHANKQIIVVDTFLDGEQRDIIAFVLDERFRERVDASLNELLARGLGTVFQRSKESTLRDLAQSLVVDLGGDTTPRASIIMKTDVFREEQVPKILNTEFTEFA